MANKQKTRVVLPGGIQGLVHTLQNGSPDAPVTPKVDVSKINADADEPADTAPANTTSANTTPADPVSAPAPGTPRTPDNTTQPSYGTSAAADKTTISAVAAEPAAAQTVTEPAAVGVGEDASSRPARGRRPKENTMKEYTVVKDDSRDSWDLFLDMAKQYKDGGGKLATIYIDESLKNVLDRMKYCGPEKLSTSAILSSIVARFIFDHEDDIKRVMFSGRLI